MSEKPPLRCYFCMGVVTEDDYCLGCNEYVCEDCDDLAPWGQHDPEDHQEEPDDDDE